MSDFAAYLIQTEHLLLMVAVSAVISLAPKIIPGLDGNPYWVRLLPVLPVVVCSVAVWLPGLGQGNALERILLGIVLGSFAGQAYKIIRQAVCGNDRRIRDHPRARL